MIIFNVCLFNRIDNIFMRKVSYMCWECVALSTSACSSLIACFVAPYDYNVASVRAEVS